MSHEHRTSLTTNLMVRIMIFRALVLSLGMVSLSSASDCFPPDVRAGVTLEGDNVTFEIVDVEACWVKAVVCSKGHCRPDYYWLHASKIELFKGGKIE